MKTNRIRWLIPLFLFFGILFFCSLTVYAVPTAPDKVTVSVQKNNANITQAAKNSVVTIKAWASGGSGASGAYYEYSFAYKMQNTSAWNTIRTFSTDQSVNYTLTEAGNYTFRVNARVKDSTGNSQAISQDISVKSVGVSNTSTISSSAINVGESVTINASATGGNAYEYYYSVSTNGGRAIVQTLLNMSLLLHIPINLPPKEPTGFELLQEINQRVRPMKRYSV